MIRGFPHDGRKHREKTLVRPPFPDGYALSPSVSTMVCRFCALSTCSRLSAIAAVLSSAFEPQTAMSPTAMMTAAFGMVDSVSGEPGGGVGFSSPPHAAESPIVTSVIAPLSRTPRCLEVAALPLN